MKNFLVRINYSSINEDSISEIRALNIKSSDRILCITGSGSRTLDLLTQNPKEIISIDINPSQNYLLELKMAAIHEFDYEDFIRFIGLEVDTHRLEKYYRVSHLLSKQAKKFWDKNQRLIRMGVIYQGEWEKYFRLLAVALKIIKSKELKKLFNCKTLEEQRNVWNEEWDTLPWQVFLKIISARMCWKYLFRDPAFFRYVPKNFSILRYLHFKFNNGANNLQFSQSPFVSILMKGKLEIGAGLPPHLVESNYKILKSNLQRVRPTTASLLEYLSNGTTEKFDSFSLSDMTSYTSPSEFENLYQNILRHSKEGASICERQFLVKREIPTSIQNKLHRNYDLENDLEKTDSSLFYSFHCLQTSGEGNAQS
ncbi:MAG: DUF3419 family protein [Ignavibacteria bacterium]|nr:DUF3419 family protein [Ignavibacteria bacterium]